MNPKDDENMLVLRGIQAKYVSRERLVHELMSFFGSPWWTKCDIDI